MSEKKADLSRRSVLKGIAVMPLAAAVGYSTLARAEDLKVDDPLAKSMGYVTKSATDGQSCSTCQLYQGGDAPKGACPIFAGKEVVATGWCKSWTKKS
jgi:hypothetical protein